MKRISRMSEKEKEKYLEKSLKDAQAAVPKKYRGMSAVEFLRGKRYAKRALRLK